MQNSTSQFRDDSRFRRELLLKAQHLMQTIDSLEDQLERYKEFDLPAFSVWHARLLEQELGCLSSLEREHADVVQFHNAIVALAKHRRVSMAKAFNLLKQEEAVYQDGNASVRRRIDEQRRKRESAMQGQLAVSAGNAGGSTEASKIPITSDPDINVQDSELDRLAANPAKFIFRKLARRLHPDLQGPHAEPAELRWQKRIWHIAQSSLQKGDIQTLETLYKITLLRQLDIGALTTEDALRTIDWLKCELNLVQSEISHAALTPAWEFTRRRDLQDLAARLRQGLQAEMATLEAETQALRGQHAYLEVLSCEKAIRRQRAEAGIHQLNLFE